MTSPSLLELIPSSAVYRRIALDPRLNALGPWQEATEKFVIPEDENSTWTGLANGASMLGMRILPAHLNFAHEVLKQNAESLDALDRGIERGQLQFGEFQSLEQIPIDTDFVSRLGDVARLRLIRFRLRVSEGDHVSAAEELFRVKKIGSMICNGEGQMLHYLAGLWLRAAALRGFGHLATKIQTPRAVLDRIFETLNEDIKASDGLAQSLRVDLCTITLTQMDRALEDPDLEKVVDKLLEVYYVPRHNPATTVRGSEYAAIADGWLQERRRQILRLLGDHPNPFDKAATARLMGVIVAETIRDLNYSRKSAFLNIIGHLHRMGRKMRLHRLARKTRFWPAELTPGVRIDTTGSVDVKSLAEGKVATIQVPSRNLSEVGLAALRAKLSRIDNPIGLMLAEHLMAHDYSSHLLEHLKKMKTMRELLKAYFNCG